MSPERRYWGGVYTILGSRIPRVAQQLEEQGRYGLFAGQNWGPPWIPLAAAAAATKRVQLGTSIAIAAARSPVETAFAALDMDRISDGRFILGLGSSTRWVTRSHFGVDIDRPVAHLRESVRAIRHVIENAHLGLMPFEGDFFQMDFQGLDPTPPPVRTDLPVWLGALRGSMTRLAGEIADGLIGHPLWGVDLWLGQIQKDLREGAARADRDPQSVHQCVYLTVATSPRPSEAFADARRFVAAYAAIEQYAGFFADRGFGEQAERIRGAWADGDREGAAGLVDEAMARAFVVYGEPDRVRAEVERAWKVADSMLIAAPSWGIALDRVGYYTKQINEVFFSR
jgi:alkanesulfonate monooxygenase SsuD/methylene tetrahydromethanopterin reductase-like flavin-dependent oxidoreductase (luciferase family)